MASELPTEIWDQIACYLSESQLFELRLLNSFFLNYWMNLRWKEVEIDYTGGNVLKRIVYVRHET